MTDSNDSRMVRLPVREMRAEPAPQRATDPITQAIEALEHSEPKAKHYEEARGRHASALASLRDLQKGSGDLPPLPEPIAHVNLNGVIHEAGYQWLPVETLESLHTADQLQAYARTATAPLMARIVELEAVCEKAAWHLEHASAETNGLDENESNNLHALVTSLNAALSELRRVGGRQG